jgi:hypothetical protein
MLVLYDRNLLFVIRSAILCCRCRPANARAMCLYTTSGLFQHSPPHTSPFLSATDAPIQSQAFKPPPQSSVLNTQPKLNHNIPNPDRPPFCISALLIRCGHVSILNHHTDKTLADVLDLVVGVEVFDVVADGDGCRSPGEGEGVLVYIGCVNRGNGKGDWTARCRGSCRGRGGKISHGK